ncbi:unnamed protein product [Clonostachys rosea]|uniref:Chitinase n=1 Tax=Bionectria ochroleuca TaxID=29856 RepID=A0ABY6USE0_BIOOC|nr:unnamed protein product [Clonostachys rosea]
MSWMDSWSRPSKSATTPAPLYLLPGGESTPYCHSCGRVISTRRAAVKKNKSSEAPKYCSHKCRSRKPGRVDRELERAFVHFLTKGDEDKGQGHKKKHRVKGDARILVSCSTVENHVFGPSRSENDQASSLSDTDSEHDDGPVDDRDEPSGVIDHEFDKQRHSDAPVHLSVRAGTRIRPPQSVSEVNGSVGGEKGWAERIEETDQMLEKRRAGQRRANEREMTKRAARRGVVFGFNLDTDNTSSKDGEPRRGLCEAVMSGKVVEPSFAKGDWAIRWRD